MAQPQRGDHSEERLLERLQLIEALFAGAGTEGERDAAGKARERILERLREFERVDPPREHKFSLPDVWARQVFIALLRRYDIKPYRYKRQRQTTVMARVSASFVDQTLWPEYEELSKTLHSYLADVTERVISQVIHRDVGDVDLVSESPRLGS